SDAGALELPHPRPDRDRDDPAPEAAPSLRCRQLLDTLLRPCWPEQSARWSERLISEFGSIARVLAAPPSAQARVVEGNQSVVAFLASVRGVMLRCLAHEAFGGPVLSTSQELIDYLRADMAHAQVERFRVLYLNAQNRL